MANFADDILGIDPNNNGIYGSTIGKVTEPIEDWMTDDDAIDAKKRQDEITKKQLSAADRAEARSDEVWNFWKDNYGQKEIDFAAKTFGNNSADLRPGMERLDTLARQDSTSGLQGLRARPAVSSQDYLGLNTASKVSGQDFLNESRAPIAYYENDPLQYETEAGRAAADVQQSADRERQAAGRRMMSRGINPNSGAALEFDRLAGLQTSANKVLASNSARGMARDADYGRKLTDYERRIRGMGLANDTDQGDFMRRTAVMDRAGGADREEFSRGLSLAGEQRAGRIDNFNLAKQALDTRQGVEQNNFNRNIATFQLGRGLQPVGLALSNQSMGGLQSASNAYGQVASRSNPAMDDLMGVAKLAGTIYGMK